MTFQTSPSTQQTNSQTTTSAFTHTIPKLVELGISRICHNRNLFPRSFFRQIFIGNKTFYAFDFNSTQQYSQTSLQEVFLTEGEEEEEEEEKEVYHSLSFHGTLSIMEPERKKKLTSRTGYSREEEDLFREEVDLLQNLIRDGITRAMEEGELNRVTLNIHAPKKKRKKKKEKDVLEESYVFDLTQAIFDRTRNHHPTSESILQKLQRCSSFRPLSSKQRNGWKNISLSNSFRKSRYLSLWIEFKVPPHDLDSHYHYSLKNIWNRHKRLRSHEKDKLISLLTQSPSLANSNYTSSENNSSCGMIIELDNNHDQIISQTTNPTLQTSITQQLLPKSKAFAIPYVLSPRIYLPCKILSVQYPKYKVLFYTSKKLQYRRKMKQWIPVNKIMSVEDMLNRIESVLVEKPKNLEEVAIDLSVDKKLIQVVEMYMNEKREKEKEMEEHEWNSQEDESKDDKTEMEEETDSSKEDDKEFTEVDDDETKENERNSQEEYCSKDVSWKENMDDDETKEYEWNSQEEENSKDISRKENIDDDVTKEYEWNSQEEENSKDVSRKENIDDDVTKEYEWNSQDEENSKHETRKENMDDDETKEYEWNSQEEEEKLKDLSWRENMDDDNEIKEYERSSQEEEEDSKNENGNENRDNDETKECEWNSQQEEEKSKTKTWKKNMYDDKTKEYKLNSQEDENPNNQTWKDNRNNDERKDYEWNSQDKEEEEMSTNDAWKETKNKPDYSSDDLEEEQSFSLVRETKRARYSCIIHPIITCL